MRTAEEWIPFSWYCVNCGKIVTGSRNGTGDIKVVCKRCRTEMVRTLKNRKQDIIKVYVPDGMERMNK